MKRYLIPIALFVFSFGWGPAIAAAAGPGLDVLSSREAVSSNFIVRQDAYRAGNVLISRPNPTDTQILTMLGSYGINTPEDYAQWLKVNMTYKSDGEKDSWSGPQETLEIKSGDCEDYAFLNAAVLSVLGFHPKVIGLRGVAGLKQRKRGNHAICVFKKDGRFMYLDNEKLKLTQAATIEEFARVMHARYNCAFVTELTVASPL